MKPIPCRHCNEKVLILWEDLVGTIVVQADSVGAGELKYDARKHAPHHRFCKGARASRYEALRRARKRIYEDQERKQRAKLKPREPKRRKLLTKAQLEELREQYTIK